MDLENIDEVMSAMQPRAAFAVDNHLTDQGGRIPVDLTFKSMDDFRPESIVQHIDPLRQLVEARARLTDLRNKISTSEKLEDLLDDVLKSTEKVRQLSAHGDNNE